MLAVVPQFLTPSEPLVPQYLAIGATLAFTDLVVNAVYAALAARLLGVLAHALAHACGAARLRQPLHRPRRAARDVQAQLTAPRTLAARRRRGAVDDGALTRRPWRARP